MSSGREAKLSLFIEFRGFHFYLLPHVSKYMLSISHVSKRIAITFLTRNPYVKKIYRGTISCFWNYFFPIGQLAFTFCNIIVDFWYYLMFVSFIQQNLQSVCERTRFAKI